MLFDHYLIFKQWSPMFMTSKATEEDKTLVWVCFSGLGMMFYDESVILTLALTIRRPIKVDLNTLNMVGWRFSKVYIEIDLHKSMLCRFNLNNIWYKVEYEGLHLLCTTCRPCCLCVHESSYSDGKMCPG
uniref:Uncharacterized protein n=1 Tax=Cajanus cajan TaxID=3821 RepID=A0A151U5Y1_CAJCA|nr:hypothetical protein KK1_007355 [Cajanus cajan]